MPPNPLILNISRKYRNFLINFVIGLSCCFAVAQSHAFSFPHLIAAGHPVEQTRHERPHFDAPRALRLIRKQLSFGSRTIGRPGHDSARRFLDKELRRYADRVILQNFRFQGFDLTNIIGWICARGNSQQEGTTDTPSGGPCAGTKPPILLAAHWDTHPFASRDANRSRRRLPVPGANDGGSGTAILLELARGMREIRPPRDVLIVLLDGEDYGIGGEWFIGSKHFARIWKEPRPAFGILLDMVGDRNLNIHVEGYSAQKAPEVVRRIWDAARRVGARSFKPDVKHFVLDDHIPLNDAGIPTADVIDFDYPPWHTSQDTLDKVSGRSLEEVARVVIEVIYAQ